MNCALCILHLHSCTHGTGGRGCKCAECNVNANKPARQQLAMSLNQSKAIKDNLVIEESRLGNLVIDEAMWLN